MLIDASHPEETRVVVVRGQKVEEFDFESASRRQLRGNIYLAKVTRVEPSLQAAFVEYGGNRHGFLAFNEIHPDYYQIPVADRQALIEAEAQAARLEEYEDERRRMRRRRGSPKAAGPDETVAAPPEADILDALPEGKPSPDDDVADLVEAADAADSSLPALSGAAEEADGDAPPPDGEAGAEEAPASPEAPAEDGGSAEGLRSAAEAGEAPPGVASLARDDAADEDADGPAEEDEDEDEAADAGEESEPDEEEPVEEEADEEEA
ncbi:MAG TPA: ribonuclease E/G, partial [Microvirga sp.]|nr:ribonuclease E/G [Microvirga sp.]